MLMSSTVHQGTGLRYFHIANLLRDRIHQGIYKSGERLPTQHDLAKDLDVAFTTLKSALDILGREGYVTRKPGLGTFITLPQEHRPTALVVDDEENIRELFSRALAVEGWDSVTVESGQLALDRIPQQKFDLIVLDLVMVGMNGVATFREIRKLDSQVNVVICTAYAESGLIQQIMEIGPVILVRKPIRLDQLSPVLRILTPSPVG